MTSTREKIKQALETLTIYLRNARYKGENVVIINDALSTLDALVPGGEDDADIEEHFIKWYRFKNNADPDGHLRSHEDKFQWYARGARQGYEAGFVRAYKGPQTPERERLTKEHAGFVTMVNALTECANQFRMYERLHRAKPDITKANINAEYAIRCENALVAAGVVSEKKND